MIKNLLAENKNLALANVNLTKKLSWFAVTITTFVFYRLYKNISRPPRELRHIPYLNYFQMISVLMRREPISQYSRRLVEPILSLSEGLYTRTTRLGWTVYITNPKIIKSILLKQDLFPKAKIFVSNGEGSLLNKFIVGPNMIFVENADWKRHRKLANPAFQQAMPHKVFGKLTIQMFDIIDESLKKNTHLDIGDVLKRLTLDALTLAGFGFDIHALQDPDNEWLRTYQSIITGMQDPLFFFFPIFETRFLHMFPKRQVIHNDCDRFLKLMDDMIKEKRDNINKSIEDTVTSKVVTEDIQEKDILTLLLEGEESEGVYMTNEELKSNLCAFFSAGHDSTTGALSFALYHLAVNKDIQKKARDEVLGVLGDSNRDIIPTTAQTKAMNYLNMIIKETLRIQPSVPVASARKAKEDCKLGDVFIPKDTILLIDIYNTHRSPSNWDDPHTFNPERFKPGGEADQKISGEFGNPWIPFSNGARQCIGMNFSLAEQRVVLSMLLRKYTWSLPKDSTHETNVITKGIFFIVAKDLELSFTPRY